MGVTNALLIRAAYGWDEAVDDGSESEFGRREALYGLGSYSSPADVARTAAARFAISASPRYQFDAIHSPANDESLAYAGYTVGDRVPVATDRYGTTEERVVSFSVSENRDDGRALVTSTLNDVVLYASPEENFLALLAQATKKMINGTGRGAWIEAQPVTPPAQIESVGLPLPSPPECGFFDSAWDTADGLCGDNEIVFGDTGVDLVGFTWNPATVNMHGAVMLVSDTAPINHPSPSLSGCFHTIDVLLVEDFVDNLTASNPGWNGPPYYVTVIHFVAYGPPSAGDMRLDLGATQTATGPGFAVTPTGVPVFFASTAVANTAGDASGIRQSATSPGFAALDSLTVGCDSVTGTYGGLSAPGSPYPTPFSRSGGVCANGSGVVAYWNMLAFIDIPVSYLAGDLSTKLDAVDAAWANPAVGPTPNGGSTMINWIPLG